MGGGRKGSLLVATLTAGLCACSTTDEVPDGPVVDSFKIEGTQALKPRELKKKVLTSASFLPWLPFFGKEEHFDPNAWTADQRRIERYYQAHGFYQAHVTGDEVTPGKKENHVDLKLTVKEGQPTTIERFEVEGLDGLAPDQREGVLKKLPSAARGRVFLEEEWNETQALLKRRLKSLGYAEAMPRAKAEVDVDKHEADLEIEANPGQRYRFGEVYVSDPDEHVNPRLIRDQVEAVITKGEWFNPEALEEAQARVFNMGVFSAVKVNATALEQASGIAPVAVDVREAPFTTWRGGGGIGADPLRSEVRGQFMYENRNFLGGTRRLTIRLRAGYAALAPSTSTGLFALASVGQPGFQHGPFGTLTIEAEQPHFLTRYTSIVGTLEPSYQLEPAYRAGGGSGRLAFVYKPSSHVTSSFSVNASLFLLAAPPSLGASTTQFVGCGLTCELHYADESIAWDRRDQPLEPHDGWYLALSLQEGGNTLGNGGWLLFNFFKVLPEARYYVSAFDKALTIAARVRVGAMLTVAGSAPIPVRFFSGGNEMRGFSARRLAPYEVAPRADCRDLAVDPVVAKRGGCPGYGEGLPVGGYNLLDGSFELRWNVWDALTIATFVDYGYVTASGFGLDLLRGLNVATGVGVRYVTPIGPIRVDVALRLPWFGSPLQQEGPLLPHAVNRGCFLGIAPGSSDVYPGSPEGQCAFHLSVGEAW